MPHLSIRLTDLDAERLKVLLERRGLHPSRGRATLIRALIEEDLTRGEDHQPPVADEQELAELLTKEARAGSVPAMRELRSILKTPPSDAGGARPSAKPDEGAKPKGAFDALDELAPRRASKQKAAKPKKAKAKARRGS